MSWIRDSCTVLYAPVIRQLLTTGNQPGAATVQPRSRHAAEAAGGATLAASETVLGLVTAAGDLRGVMAKLLRGLKALDSAQ